MVQVQVLWGVLFYVVYCDCMIRKNTSWHHGHVNFNVQGWLNKYDPGNEQVSPQLTQRLQHICIHPPTESDLWDDLARGDHLVMQFSFDSDSMANNSFGSGSPQRVPVPHTYVGILHTAPGKVRQLASYRRPDAAIKTKSVMTGKCATHCSKDGKRSCRQATCQATRQQNPRKK